MTYTISLFTLLLSLSFNVMAESNWSASDDTNAAPWVGREPKDMPTLINNFRQSCERRNLPAFEKKIKPYDKAETWNRDHCICIARFYIAKNMPVAVQIANMHLRDALKSLPPLPPDLMMGIDVYHEMQEECAKNPRYVSQAEVELRADKEIEARERQNKGALKPGTKKPKLPTRPQKTPQSLDEPEARE